MMIDLADLDPNMMVDPADLDPADLDLADLDTMDSSELMNFYHANNGGQHNKNRRRLARYAACKATALSFRLGGNVASAQDYEDIAERIYHELPKYLQW